MKNYSNEYPAIWAQLGCELTKIFLCGDTTTTREPKFQTSLTHLNPHHPANMDKQATAPSAPVTAIPVVEYTYLDLSRTQPIPEDFITYDCLKILF